MDPSAHCRSTSLWLLPPGWSVTYCDVFNRSDKVEEVDAVSSQLSQTNVVGNIHLFHLFLPLVLKSKVKKVITISTGLADLDLTNECEVDIGALYAASKAAMNVIVAKFNAQYKKDGVLFLSISPGLVDTGHYADCMFPFLPFQNYNSLDPFINAYPQPLRKRCRAWENSWPSSSPMRLTSRAQSVRKNPFDKSGRPGRRPASRVVLVVPLSRTLETSSGCKIEVPLHQLHQIHLLIYV